MGVPLVIFLAVLALGSIVDDDAKSGLTTIFPHKAFILYVFVPFIIGKDKPRSEISKNGSGGTPLMEWYKTEKSVGHMYNKMAMHF